MRPPKFVFTVRRLMLVVAAVGVVIGGVTLASRRGHYRKQALKHEVLESLFRHGHVHFGPDPERAAHHAAMKIKYQRAAARPWLSIEPDPPGPVQLRRIDAEILDLPIHGEIGFIFPGESRTTSRHLASFFPEHS